MKWGTLRATVVERGRRRRAWTRERREFYRAHCPVFPTTAAVDFSAQTIYRLGRRPLRGASRDRGRPSAADDYFSAVPLVFRRLPPIPRHRWTMRVYRLSYPRTEQRDARVKYVCLACGYIDFRATECVGACVRVCVMLRTNIESVPENIFRKARVGGGVLSYIYNRLHRI